MSNILEKLYKKLEIEPEYHCGVYYKSIDGDKFYEYQSACGRLDNETEEEVAQRLQQNWRLQGYYNRIIEKVEIIPYYRPIPILQIEELILKLNTEKVNKEFCLQRYGTSINGFGYSYAFNKENYHRYDEDCEDNFWETEFYDTRQEALADLILTLWDLFTEDDKNKIKKYIEWNRE